MPQYEKIRKNASKPLGSSRYLPAKILGLSYDHEHLIDRAGSAEATLRWLAREPPEMEESRLPLTRIIKDGRRMSDVVGWIRDLIKKAPPQRQRVEINGAIGEVIELARGEAGKNRISVQTHFADSLPAVEADRTQLQLVMLNLIMNASKPSVRATKIRVNCYWHFGERVSWRARLCTRYGAGHYLGKPRSPFRSILYHQAGWHGDGTIDLPFNHRRPWRANMGHSERSAGRCFSLHYPHSSTIDRFATRSTVDDEQEV